MIGHETRDEFRHEALLYAGEDEFVGRTSRFIREAVEAQEPTLVVVGARKIAGLRESLDDAAEGVCFADMAEVGRNPARIIPAWRAFVDEYAGLGTSLRGVGEPIFPERSAEALVECQRHEALLNVAFAGSPRWWLLCPYDTQALEPAVIEEALRSHPYVTNDGSHTSPRYRGLAECGTLLDVPLGAPPPRALTLSFDRRSVSAVRKLVRSRAAELGFGASQADDLAFAVHELATNSVQHGGGCGTLRLWGNEERVVAEVTDAGRIDDPLAGRVAPRADGAAGGRGLWLANQLCDLLQIRSHPHGSTVRAHLSRR